jgi:enoyl-CoA hydratase
MDNFSVTLTGPVARVTLTRGEQGNRLDIPTIKALTEVFVALGNNPEIKVVQLRGDGDDFCLGRQMPPSQPGVKASAKSAMEIRGDVIDPILALYAAIRNLAIPTVATVRGAAFGLGCVLAVQCDVTIAAENARFALPELRNDIPPTLAMSGLLHAVTPKALAHLVYSTGEISAAEALQLGLLSMTAPAAELEAVSERYLDSMAARARPALSAIKEYLNTAPGQDPQVASRYGANLLSAVLASQ